uniref:Uncharacterized protein n=1 Tax=Buteo japonicus TaxID=224669 RepID=A0A8C0BAG6_9AVES
MALRSSGLQQLSFIFESNLATVSSLCVNRVHINIVSNIFLPNTDTIAERSALREHVYPKLREFCRENYGLEFQVIDLYWGVEADEWDSPELQKTRMKLLEDCLKTSAGPCFVYGLLV